MCTGLPKDIYTRVLSVSVAGAYSIVVSLLIESQRYALTQATIQSEHVTAWTNQAGDSTSNLKSDVSTVNLVSMVKGRKVPLMKPIWRQANSAAEASNVLLHTSHMRRRGILGPRRWHTH